MHDAAARMPVLRTRGAARIASPVLEGLRTEERGVPLAVADVDDTHAVSSVLRRHTLDAKEIDAHVR